MRLADEREAHAAACVVESLHGPLLGEAGVLRSLASAGLADATLLGRRAAHLSGGQRFRLSLARAFLRCAQPGTPSDRRPTLLVADEFAVSLDRLSARCLARAVRKWVDRSSAVGSSGEGKTGTHGGAALVAATPHDDLLEDLKPDVLVVVSDDGSFNLL